MVVLQVNSDVLAGGEHPPGWNGGTPGDPVQPAWWADHSFSGGGRELPDRRRLARPTWAVALWVCLFAVGCTPGIRWRLDSFERVHADSAAANKLTFVYLRNWYAVACTNFEENVLKNPAVLEATMDMYCVPLDFDWARNLAEEWDLRVPPAFAIVDPQGGVLASGSGSISLESLLDAIHNAKSLHAQELRPEPSP